jgi:hypothetical protein
MEATTAVMVVVVVVAAAGVVVCGGGGGGSWGGGLWWWASEKLKLAGPEIENPKATSKSICEQMHSQPTDVSLSHSIWSTGSLLQVTTNIIFVTKQSNKETLG